MAPVDESRAERVAGRVSDRPGVGARVAAYVDLTKPKQTGLLMATGIGAYLMSAGPGPDALAFAVGMLALASAISGSTALNMVIDRDIDARMSRTAARPLPSGEMPVTSAHVLGLVLSGVGIGTAWLLGPVFGAAVTIGLLFDVVIYSLWLKRRTPYSILIGGISGGMPAVAGRALATGSVDAVALLLGAGVVLWIPAHILTLAMKYAEEYEQAGVPVWPRVYGEASTRRLIAVATAGAAVVLVAAGVLTGIRAGALAVLLAAGVALAGLTVAAFVRPSERANWLLFKAASAYMLVAFTCLTAGAVL